MTGVFPVANPIKYGRNYFVRRLHSGPAHYAAVAYHGGHAAAGRPERLFGDVKFLNNVLQQRMKPETISRAAMLRESPDCYKVAPEVIVGLNNKAHEKSKKRGAQTPAPETDE